MRSFSTFTRMRKLILPIFLAFLFACGDAAQEESSTVASPDIVERTDWQSAFSDRDGCMVIYSPNDGVTQVYNSSRAEKGFLPASTFKIFNAMVGLQEMAVMSTQEVIPWDGVDRGWEQWNRDHTVSSALQTSAVWFYQELAGRVGKDAMQKWITEAEYGNGLMGEDVRTFWLDGDLKISAMEQVEFLEKLEGRRLPFDRKHQDAVYRMLPYEQTPAFTVRAKTGWSISDEEQIGWLVGYADFEGGTQIFALNIDLAQNEDGNIRKAILYDILNRIASEQMEVTS